MTATSKHAMDPGELLVRLSELARAAGLEVREVRGTTADTEAAASSGVCRVRDAIWVVLSRADTVEARIDVLASALAQHARPFVEGRYLAPAVRACLRLDADPG